MRLSTAEAAAIRGVATDLIGPDARVWLFGSRTDDSARGGDIDLLIEARHTLDSTLRVSLQFAAELQLRIGERKVDVLVLDPTTPRQPIHEAALAEGVELT